MTRAFLHQQVGNRLYERFLDDTNGFVIFTELFDQVVKLFQTLLAIPGRNHDLPREESMFNRVAGYGALSPLGFRPSGAKCVSRLAWILRSDTGRLRARFSGDGGVEDLCEGSSRDMRRFSR